ncbi:hypothetical protein GH714_000468 [Hevea brasiliensis]|uniref:Transposase-associated domain-containing protein n=1 Tax=Hevea brasiliensis TaxID=3981 RepID=A0A6A6K909_HEVBR|nr:hypothetical protein GH714_000468 [Hevea brasiliensis]
MSVDRSWMYKRLDVNGFLNPEFEVGVEYFLNFAYAQVDLVSNDKIRCPCSKCKNKKYLQRIDVTYHLYKFGFVGAYTQWDAHGEGFTSEFNSLPTSSTSIDDMTQPTDTNNYRRCLVEYHHLEVEDGVDRTQYLNPCSLWDEQDEDQSIGHEPLQLPVDTQVSPTPLQLGGQVAASSSSSVRTRGPNLGQPAPVNPTNRQMIRLRGLVFLDISVSRSITNDIKMHFTAPWKTWAEIPNKMKDELFGKFQGRYMWDETEEQNVRLAWDKLGKDRFRDILNRARNEMLVKHKKSDIAYLHNLGPNWMKAETKKLGRPPNKIEVFRATHTKKGADGVFIDGKLQRSMKIMQVQLWRNMVLIRIPANI